MLSNPRMLIPIMAAQYLTGDPLEAGSDAPPNPS